VNAVKVAQGLALGRVAIGAALLIAPKASAQRWLGDDADRQATQVVVRGLGARDLVMGLIALHTAAHPQVGPRWQRTLAACDIVDGASTLLARSALPRNGVIGTAAIAGGAAVAEALVAQALASRS
jgi:hypothetical protein